MTNGNALAVWNIRITPIKLGIAMKLFDPTGTNLTDAIRILSAHPYDKKQWGDGPSVNSLPDGGAFIAWHEEHRTIKKFFDNKVKIKNQIVGRSVSFVPPPPPDSQPYPIEIIHEVSASNDKQK